MREPPGIGPRVLGHNVTHVAGGLPDGQSPHCRPGCEPGVFLTGYQPVLHRPPHRSPGCQPGVFLTGYQPVLRRSLPLARLMAAFLFALTILAPARAENREQRFKEYDARRMETLEKLAQGGGLWGATARFYLKKDVDEASRIVMDTDFSNIYWANQTEFIPLYEMFNADTGSRGKLLSREATDKIRGYFWGRFRPGAKDARHALFLPDQPWVYWGNQNHGFVYQTLFYTAAKALKGIPQYTEQFDPVKHVPLSEDLRNDPELAKMTLADFAERAHRMWRNRFLWMARQGLWAEDMIYRTYNVEGTYNLAYHDADPVVRKRAEMILDLHWLLYALQTVDGQFGGAQNRFKPHYSGYHPERGTGWYYFGGRPGSQACMAALFGDYLPPETAYQLLENEAQRGCFVLRERLTQFRSETGQPPYTYKYSYVTPEYVLSSYVAHDLQKGPGRYHERAFNGITFGKARAILRLGPGVSFESYHCMQIGPFLLARWYGQEIVGADTPWGRRVGSLLPYASIIRREGGGAEIKPVVYEDGWLFGEAGDAYVALRAAAGRCLVSKHDFHLPTQKTPLVLRAGGVTEDGSFEDFKERVLSNTVEFTPSWSEGQGPAKVEAVRHTFTAPSFEVCSTRTGNGLAGPLDTCGVFFPAGGGVTPRVGDKGTAGITVVQHHNVLLLRKGPSAPADMHLRFDLSGPVEKQVTQHEKWWVCREGPAYVAIRELPRVNEFEMADEAEGAEEEAPALEGPKPASPLMKDRLVIADPLAPVVLVAGRQDTFPSLDAFLAALKAHEFSVQNGVLTYTFTDTNGKPATLTVNTEKDSAPPTINGKEIDGTWTAEAPRIVEDTKLGTVGLLPLNGIEWTVTYENPKWGEMRFRPYPNRPADEWRQVNGKPVALPDKLFDSPYLTSDYNRGVITATFGGRKLVLDFNKNERREE